MPSRGKAATKVGKRQKQALSSSSAGNKNNASLIGGQKKVQPSSQAKDSASQPVTVRLLSTNAEKWIFACEAGDPKEFVDFINSNLQGQDCVHFADTYQTLDEDQKQQIWTCVLDTAKKAEEDRNPAYAKATATLISRVLPVLPRGVPNACLESVLRLASWLSPDLSANDADSFSAAEAVCKVCETWFLEDRSSRLQFTDSMLHHLFTQCLGSHGKSSHVRRLQMISEAASIVPASRLQPLLQAACIHPVFLHSADGRKFIASCLGEVPELVPGCAEAFIECLPAARKGVLEGTGASWFRAWKDGDPALQASIELNFIQELATRSCLAATDDLSSRCRRVLRPWHRSKDAEGVDEMLFRVHSAFVFRYLSCANAGIRRRAGMLLAEAMPLQDPSLSAAELDDSLQEQFDCLKRMIKDPCPHVREAGVHAICRVIGVYWEAVPAGSIRTLLNTMVGELTVDGASPAVRAAVATGLAFLLDCPLSVPTLQALLPRCRHMLHDPAVQVRMCMVDLLIKVKSVRAIRFFDIVPPEDLLARLCADAFKPAVAVRIVELLTPSFWPPGKSLEEQGSRMLALAARHPAAAVAFARHMPNSVGLADSARAAMFLLKCLLGSLGCANSSSEAMDEEGQSSKRKRGNGGKKSKGKKQSTGAAVDADDAFIPEGVQLTEEETATLAGCVACLLDGVKREAGGELVEQMEQEIKDVIDDQAIQHLAQVPKDSLFPLMSALAISHPIVEEKAAQVLSSGAVGDAIVEEVTLWFLARGRGTALLRIVAAAASKSQDVTMRQDTAGWLLHVASNGNGRAVRLFDTSSAASRNAAVASLLNASASIVDEDMSEEQKIQTMQWMCGAAARIIALPGLPENELQRSVQSADHALESIHAREEDSSQQAGKILLCNILSALADVAACGGLSANIVDTVACFCNSVPEGMIEEVSSYVARVAVQLADGGENPYEAIRLLRCAADGAFVSFTAMQAAQCVTLCSDVRDAEEAASAWVATAGKTTAAFSTFKGALLRAGQAFSFISRW